MRLIQFRNILKSDLGVDQELTDLELERSIDKSVRDLSRVFPLGRVLDLTLDFAVTGEAFVAGAVGVAVQLARVMLEPKSESVSNGATTYTRDTDYTMDYATGTIATKAGGALVPTTVCTISYRTSAVYFDISSIIPSLYKIQRVLYPAGQVPEQSCSFRVFNNILEITGYGTGTQSKLASGNHLHIYYLTSHSGPTVESSGTYPEVLDEVVAKGAAAHLLEMQAVKCDHQSLSDLASSRTTLLSLSTVHTAIANLRTGIATDHTALTAALVAVQAAGGPFDRASLALNKIVTNCDLAVSNLSLAASSPLTKALAALDALDWTAVESALGKVQTHSGTDAKSALDSALGLMLTVSTDIADAKSNAGSSSGALDEVRKILDTNSASALKTCDLAEAKASEASGYIDGGQAVAAQAQDSLTRIDGADHLSGAWAKVEKFILNIDATIPSAESFLEDGRARINSVNLGEQVAQNYKLFADSAIESAKAYSTRIDGLLAEAKQFSDLASLYMQASQTKATQAQRYTESASIRADLAKTYVSEATTRGSVVTDYINVAQQRLVQLQEYVEVAKERNNISAQFSTEAQQRLSELESKITRVNAYFTHAKELIDSAESYLHTAQAYAGEADGRINQAKVQVTTIEQQVGQVNAKVQELYQLIQQSNTYLQTATQYQQTATVSKELSKAFRDEADARRSEFVQLLRDNASLRADSSVVLPLQNM